MKIAVIGAGITGLAAAHDLTKSGHQVVLFESAPQVGGLASGFKADGWAWTLERFYHHWFATDRHALELASDLGCREKVFFNRPTTVMYHNGRFYPLDSPLTALSFPGLGWGVRKLRFGLTTLYLRLSSDWRHLERVTAADWLTRWAGKRVYSTMWEPLLQGKFGRFAPQIPMSWLWARLHARTTRLGTFEGGFQAFMDILSDRVRQQGGEIRLQQQVTRITASTEPGVLVEVDGTEHRFDHCLATCSPHLLAELAPQLPSDYRRQLQQLHSMGAVVLVLALKKRLSKHYWFNLPAQAGFPFLALVEHTNFVSPDHFGGEHIIYCGDYLETNHEHFSLQKEELLARFLPALTRFNADFKPGWVRRSWLFRSPYAQPLPRVDGSGALPALRTPMPGLWMASMSQIYPWDRGTNYAIELGRRVAASLHSS